MPAVTGALVLLSSATSVPLPVATLALAGTVVTALASSFPPPQQRLSPSAGPRACLQFLLQPAILRLGSTPTEKGKHRCFLYFR